MDDRCFDDVCKSLESQSPEKAIEYVRERTIDSDDVDACKLFLFQ
jgi:hypothetical protein